MRKTKKVIKKPTRNPTSLTMLSKRMQDFEDRLILQQNRMTAFECKRHKDVQDEVLIAINELRQAGKIK